MLHLATLSGVLACLMRHFRASLASLPLLSQPLGSLPLGTWSPDAAVAHSDFLPDSKERRQWRKLQVGGRGMGGQGRPAWAGCAALVDRGGRSSCVDEKVARLVMAKSSLDSTVMEQTRKSKLQAHAGKAWGWTVT